MKKILVLLLVLVFSLLSGCTSVPVKLGSTSVNTEQYDFSAGRQISASASGFQLLLFIPISINDRQRTAYQSLLGQAGDGFITDVKVTESWTYGLVGTVHTTQLDATVYPRKK